MKNTHQYDETVLGYNSDYINANIEQGIYIYICRWTIWTSIAQEIDNCNYSSLEHEWITFLCAIFQMYA